MRTTGLDHAQAMRAMDAIDRNARAQAQLIEDLLDTSRVVSGKLRIDLAGTDLRALLASAVESFAPLARSRGVTLDARLEDVGLIPADAARLQQVIGNMLSNAVKFTPPPGRIDVSLRQTATDVEIRVADTGIGIAPEFLPYVFDRFRQADSTTTRAHGGLGIGLAIARHLVELHGGTIRAESAGENSGSTFIVLLPADPIRRDAPVPPLPAVVAAHTLDGLRVLVVDDEPDARELLRTVLGTAGATVTAAASVAEARAHLLSSRPDVLIADIAMPGEDGYALIRGIRQDEHASGQSRLPAVALSAYAREEDRARSLGAGFDVHLTKPLDYGALLQAIADVTVA
jgi:CheY-like chemotaxis protein/anti-sigma regulatory factor (Ser/Thr protein kinase)